MRVTLGGEMIFGRLTTSTLAMESVGEEMSIPGDPDTSGPQAFCCDPINAT
jgi:hypothetical protein